MKSTLRNIFHSGKFVAGFVIFVFLLMERLCITLMTRLGATTV